MPSVATAWLRNGLVAVLSVAIGLAACEAALRLFHPRYDFAANPAGEEAGETYWAVRHPDTGVPHRFIYNNLGGRQSRDFPPEVLDATVNVAVFGDSQTENVFMPAQYSFTEPLDFLLNVGAQVDGEGDTKVATLSEPRFSVLGFGSAQYGAARSYLRWRAIVGGGGGASSRMCSTWSFTTTSTISETRFVSGLCGLANPERCCPAARRERRRGSERSPACT